MAPTSLTRFFSELRRAQVSPLQVQLVLVFAISTLLNIGFYQMSVWQENAAGQNLPRLLRAWDSLVWYVWPLATPAMAWLIRRYPLTRGRALTGSLRLIAGSIVIYLIVAHFRFFLRVLPTLGRWEDLPVTWEAYLATNLLLLPLDFLTYCGFFAVTFAIDYYFRYRARLDESRALQLRTVQLQAELAHAQLAALRGQLHPHFLSNSFNAVATLVRQQKNAQAVEMIVKLGALLRLSAETSVLDEISLRQELEFTSRYLEVERLRFGEKLDVTLDVDEEAMGALVPNLLLQPLVENAIKHGISQRVTPGRVALSARHTGDRLSLELLNDGPEEPITRPSGAAGIGLTNTRSRLQTLYGHDYFFELVGTPEGGTAVRLSIPWKTAPVSSVKGELGLLARDEKNQSSHSR